MIVWLVIAVFGMNKNIIGASYSGQQQYIYKFCEACHKQLAVQEKHVSFPAY